MRIGILGGTFDPIHLGHIRPALEIKQQLQLDEVWLMPNHIPPHKQSTNVDSQHRLAMVEQICQQYNELKLCDIEIKRHLPSYTVVTLQQLQQAYPQHQFYFIMGMDSFIGLPSWHLWQQLFALCHIVLCQRPGWQLDVAHPMHTILQQKAISCSAHIAKLPTTDHQPTTGAIIPVDINLQDISSTVVRKKLQRHEDVSGLIAPCTETYIQQHQLYLS
ncbi:nicotinate-nucleotide adenylyltransferase [Shewanella subflava]|uniref:Probable nicotinate-nucleotide adenylyltransferase n=1 Tax=Shewanella subflava TaxID=2986476 RepID=A0ABT3IAG1_9GAMM|nr:nicotinate-nucleotide adenylyltransferase [Shewanella subflava]MCW3172955.1 nicotinate-nucleotide adenylyltransferase [Shewanella subflava]